MTGPRRLSDTPLMKWSRDVIRDDIPRGLLNTLAVMGVTEFEREHDARELMNQYDDWRDAIASLF